MKISYFKLVIILFISSLGFSQKPLLRSGIDYYFSIENNINVPTVNKNNDGTITLTHQEQYITDIFAKYEIYDFHLTNPDSSQKRFTINFNSKDLINELAQNVPDEVFYNLGSFKTSAISQDIITALDGLNFDVMKYMSNYDELCGDCPIVHEVPDDFKLSVTFNYNIEKDVLYMKSNGVSPCGNEFYITLKGGNPDNGTNRLQLWESNSISTTISDNSQPCNNIEYTLYSILGIYNNGYSSGNFKTSINSETNHIDLYLTDDPIAGSHHIELSEEKLSITDELFKQIKPFQTKENPYLQISNIGNQNIHIDIYSITGQKIISNKIFKNNSIDISNFQKGVYLIKLSNTNKQQKVFKFLKN
ncbi:T9SS type A sorting domain-containing protein [Thalassobellus citreus]|uniref:T9SS type A sorting domain-containing protein n=1 Tax=Thalassobellus citreus TaxID=3367752 RepID=UPI0037A673FE